MCVVLFCLVLSLASEQIHSSFELPFFHRALPLHINYNGVDLFKGHAEVEKVNIIFYQLVLIRLNLVFIGVTFVHNVFHNFFRYCGMFLRVGIHTTYTFQDLAKPLILASSRKLSEREMRESLKNKNLYLTLFSMTENFFEGHSETEGLTLPINSDLSEFKLLHTE